MAKRKRRVNENREFQPRVWTDDEDNLLIKLSEEHPDKNISETLGRTVSAICNRRYILRERGVMKD